jgi:hypothetical protein
MTLDARSTGVSSSEGSFQSSKTVSCLVSRSFMPTVMNGCANLSTTLANAKDLGYSMAKDANVSGLRSRSSSRICTYQGYVVLSSGSLIFTNCLFQHFRHIYVLDDKIEHLNHDSLPKLGLWIACTYALAKNKCIDNQKKLDKVGIDLEILWEEWRKQVTAQTKPLPSELI